MNTDNDEKFLNDLNVNLWITANAGSGKTTKLIERFLFLLKNNIKPEEIVCITYTEVGSSEMINRIISKAKENGFSNITKDKLRISTIHGFCRKLLLLNNKIPEDVGVISNNDSLTEEMIKTIVNDFSLNKNNLWFINELAKVQGISQFYDLVKTIINDKQLYFFSLFDKIIKMDKKEGLFDCIDESKLYQLLPKNLQHFILEKDNLKNNLDKEKLFLENELETQGYYLINLAKEKSRLKKIIEDDNFDFKKLESWKNIVFNAKGDELRKDFESIDNDFCRRIQKYFINKKIQNSVNVSYAIIHLAYNVLKKYQDFKTNLAVCTYDDFLFQTLELLKENCLFENNNIYENGSNIKYLMLDEAQDTNPISWKIIKEIIRITKCKFFVIGDEKQSIYRFQGAKIEEYENNKKIFRDLSNSLNIPFNCNIKLNMSYRSIQPILDEADKLCEDQKESFGNDNIKHICCESKLNKKKPGYVLEKKDAVQTEEYNLSNSGKNDEIEKDDWLNRTLTLRKKQEEKEQKIQDLVKNIYTKYIVANQQDINNNIFDEEDNKDIAIIYTKKGGDGLMLSILTELRKYDDINIVTNSNVESCSIYYNDILSIFYFFILQNDNMNLACLLKSEIFDFTDKMLEEICLSNDDKNTLWNLIKCRIFPDKVENEKLNYAVKTLQNIIGCNCVSDILHLIEEIIESKEHKKKYLLSFKIIKSCFDVYREKDNFNDYDVRSFILYLKEAVLKGRNGNDSSKQRIFFSTVHGVKGMEFDTVLFFDIKNDKGGGNKEAKKMFFFDSYFWYGKKGEKNFIPEISNVITEQEQQEKKEYFRLKYVAITRAKRKIVYFSSSEKNK